MGQVLRNNGRIWWFLVLDLPSVWWGRWWGDEEELLALRRLEVLVNGLDGRVLAKVDTGTIAHDCLAIESLAYCDCILGAGEGAYDTAEGLEGRPGDDGGGGVNDIAELLEVSGVEDFWVY